MVSDPSKKDCNEGLCHLFVVILYTSYSRICEFKNLLVWKIFASGNWMREHDFPELNSGCSVQSSVHQTYIIIIIIFLIIIMVTLVCMGCHNKILQTVELRQQIFISSAGWYPRSRWWLGWFLVNPLLLPCIGHLSLCLCMTFLLCTCARESSLFLPLLIRMPVLSD